MKKEKTWRKFFFEINQIVEEIHKTQEDNILRASAIITETIEKKGIIHTFGVGHSHIVAEDVFWRAGTLANVHAILEPSMTGHTEITKSGDMEKIEGTGPIILDYHRVSPGDVLIVISNSGNNAAPIDVAREGQKRGISVIAITSVEYSNFLNPLHSSGKKLKDFADVVIDNCCPIGDAVIKFEDFETKVGATSTIAGSYILNALLVQAVEEALEKGVTPDVYFNGSLSANSSQVKEHNQNLIDKYFSRIRNL